MKTAIFLFCMMASSSAFTQTSDFKELKATADSLQEAELFPESLKLYKKLLELQPKNIHLLSSMGFNNFRQKNYSKAREMYALAALYCPIDNRDFLATTYSNLSAAYSNLDDNNKAYEYALKAYRMDDQSSLALWNAASNSQNVQRYDECLAIMNNAKIEKNNAFNTLYSRCYYAKEDYEKAVKYGELWLENFDPADDFVPTIDVELEKKRLFLSYLKAAEKTDEPELRGYSKKAFAMLQNKLIKLPKETVMELFREEDNLFSRFGFPKEKVPEAFSLFIQNPNVADSAVMYYYIQDYELAYHLASKAMRYVGGLSNAEQDEVKKLEYLSFIHLLVLKLEKNKILDDQSIIIARKLYEQQFEEATDYEAFNLEDSKLDDSPFKITIQTFEIFQKQFNTENEEKFVAPYLLEIVKNTPNKKIRTFITSLLQAGRIQN